MSKPTFQIGEETLDTHLSVARTFQNPYPKGANSSDFIFKFHVIVKEASLEGLHDYSILALNQCNIFFLFFQSVVFFLYFKYHLVFAKSQSLNY